MDETGLGGQVIASVLWTRLDRPGHDACALVRVGERWRLSGAAAYCQDGAPAWLTYDVVADAAWRTLNARVEGRLGDRPARWIIVRAQEDGWTLNGIRAPDLASCLDLDLGFTPATNLLPLRRLALREGEAADAPAAWFDASEGTLSELPQRYERRTRDTYGYEAPTVGYAATLEIGPTGFVLRYPGLWHASATHPPTPRP